MSEISGLMTMDLSSLFASPIAANAGKIPGATEENAFGNLLDLVSDMQIGDEQGFEQVDFLDKRVSQIHDPAWQDVVALASGSRSADLASNFASVVPSKVPGEASVGPQAAPVKGAVEETPLVQDLALRFGELDTLARASEMNLRTTHADAKSSSVAQWAQALLSGDMKSVSVDQDAFAELRRETSLAPAVLLEKAPLAPASVKAAEAKALPADVPGFERATTTLPRVTVPAQEATVPTSGPAPRASESVVATKASIQNVADDAKSVSTGRAFASVDTGLKPRDSSPRGDGDSALSERSRPERSRSESAPKEAVSGAEFLLARGASLPVSGDKAPQAVRQAASLAVHGDGRISPSTVDFVADKVDTLKAQGGGRLRVELNPRDLGGMEIKVSMRRGHMVVELLAEKPETVAAFRQSSGELSAKLDGIAPSRLEIGDKLGTSNPTPANASTGSSQELLQARSQEPATSRSSQTMDNSRLHVVESRTDAVPLAKSGSGASTSDFASGGDSSRRQETAARDGFNRDERRNQAMSWWEMFSQERKSA